MHRTLLADDAGFGIRRFSGTHLRYYFLLAWNNVKENIGRHDAAHHRTDVQIGCARAEQLKQRPGRQANQHQYDPCKQVILTLHQPT